jgi:hypothetical protein
MLQEAMHDHLKPIIEWFHVQRLPALAVLKHNRLKMRISVSRKGTMYGFSNQTASELFWWPGYQTGIFWSALLTELHILPSHM